MNKILLLVLSLLLSISLNAKVYLYQQWHLLAKIKSLDIEESKKLRQYPNQKFIYDHLNKLIKDGKVKTVISEGCEGPIDKNFKLTFNGWNYKNLNKNLKNKFSDILTLIPLKLEVQYKDKLVTVCGDNQELIDKHGLAFSDVRGFFGYYLRFKQFKNNPQKTKIYLKALEETEKKKIKDPIKHTQSMAIKNLEAVKVYIKERNNVFLKHIIKHQKSNPAVVIGALHLDDLLLKLKKHKIDVEVVAVNGLPRNSKKMIEKLERDLK